MAPRILFDEEKADRAVRFIETHLKHTKGQWHGVPFELLPWQRDEVIRPLFGTVRADGLRQFRTAYVEVPRKNGKLLDVETPILTDSGWKTMGTLTVGDRVHAPNGDLTDVLWVSEEQSETTYRVRFSDGQEIVAGARHQWWVRDRSRGRWLIATTEEIARQLRIGARSTHREHRFCVEVPRPLQRPEARLPIPPYVLGAWLGDGASANGQITGIDEAIHAAVIAAGYPAGRTTGVTRSFLGLRGPLRELGVLGNKHVPESYLLASELQRLELLRGLMDTDGSVIRGPSRWPRCEFTTINPRLAQAVLFLARSLGWKATLREGRATISGRDISAKYRVSWTAYRDRSPFALHRKTQRLSPTPSKPTRSSSNQVVAVIPVDPRPMRCIEVADPSHCYVVGPGLVPTHNSEKGAALALKLLLADGEMGAEVYGAAKDRDQASIVFNIAASMVEQSPELSKRCQVVRSTKRIYVPKTDSVYRVIAADAAGSHGFNASGIVFDEVHTQPNRELWEVLETSTASRRQPLMIGLTTAGYDRNSLCWDLHVKALSLLKLRYPKRYAWADVPIAATDDPTFFAVVYGIAEKADWKVERTWKEANPSYGVTIQKDYFEKEVRKAADTPAYENTFRRLHLNQWTSQSVRWLPLELWDAAAGKVERAQLAGRPCYGGLDLASRSDVAAFLLLFPPESPDESFKVLARFWIPGANIERRVKKDRVPYDVWARKGLITATEGDVIHYGAIRKAIEDEARVFRIVDIGYDDWGAEQLRQELVEGGLTVEPVRQGYSSMSAPTKELLDLVRERKIEHGGNPVLRWMADNLAVRTDPNGNVMPDKKRSTEKIDGMVALILALQRAIAHRPVGKVPGQGFLEYLRERRAETEAG